MSGTEHPDGAVFRRLRRAGNATLSEMSAYSGYSIIAISRWERGLRRLRPEVATALVRALGTIAARRASRAEAGK